VTVDERGRVDLVGLHGLDLVLEKFVVLQVAVRAAAVDAVQLELERKMGPAHHAFERAGPHLVHVLELHVMLDQFVDGLDRLVVVAQVREDAVAHLRPDRFVAAVADASVRIDAGRGPLAHVVHEHAEREFQVGLLDLRQHEPDMLVDVAFGMELRRLLDAVHGRDIGQHLSEQTAAVEQVEPDLRLVGRQDQVQLVADALGADRADRFRRRADRFPGRRFDPEVEPRGEADGAQEPKAILGEAFGRAADRAQHLRVEVGLAPDVIDQPFGHRIVEKAVDGEVAPLRVLLRRGEADRFGTAAVLIGAILPEGGDLVVAIAHQHAEDAERLAGEIGHAREKALHLLGPRAGGDVVVLRLPAEEPVADAAPGEIGDVALALQARHDLGRLGFHIWERSGASSVTCGGGGRCVS